MRRRYFALLLVGSVAPGLLGAGAACAAPHANAKHRRAHKRPRPLSVPSFAVRVLTPDQVKVLQAGAFVVRVTARHTASVRLSAFTPVGRRLVPIAAPRTFRVRARRPATRNLRLAINANGRRTLSTCFATDITLVVRGQSYGSPPLSTRRHLKHAERRFRFVCRNGSLQPGPHPGGSTTRRGPYQVGLDAQPINPCSDGSWASDATTAPKCPGDRHTVFLGGYGFGSGKVGGPDPANFSTPGFSGRPATGVLASTDPTLANADGAHTRAIAITDGKSPLLLADMEVQGWFVEDKNNKTGIIDMRNRVAKDLSVDAQHVFIQSDHSHSGADALGVWGGVPESFLEYMANQTVTALERAYVTRQPGQLFYGSAPGRDLLTNQFSADPVNQSQDSDVRVLQARDGSGQPFATLVNFSAHATMLGGGNHKLSGDWLQGANPLLEKTFGGKAMTIVGTVGRTQPLRDPAGAVCGPKKLPADADSFCNVLEYGREVVSRASQALANAQPISGKPAVDAHSYLIQDPATNGAILGFDLVPGGAAGLPFIRSTSPPWLTATLLGTVTGTARIGDVLLSSMPGEAYPQIALKVQDTVTGIRKGTSQDGFMTMGLSNDQLGYIIAPFEAYPQPAQRSLFTQPLSADVIGTCTKSPDTNTCPTPSPISNDNYFFNVSHTLGERLTCALLRGADDVLHAGQTSFRDSYNRCALFANDAQMGPGSDITLGSTPLAQVPGAPTGSPDNP